MGKHHKPRRFDYNLIVIGGGSAGLVSAYIAATVNAKVALIEEDKMGGDCLNTGCVPSKALIKSARMISLMRRGQNFGIHQVNFEFKFSDIMRRVQRVIEHIAPHDSPDRYQKLGVVCKTGQAKFLDPWTISINDKAWTARSIIIATGAKPIYPNIPDLPHSLCYTSDNIWSLKSLPERLIVLGAGPIGVELAQCFVRFGSQVTLLEQGSQILPREDSDIAAYLLGRLEREGIQVRLSHKAVRVVKVGELYYLLAESANQTVRIPFDIILLAVGRSPYTQGLDLASAGVKCLEQGHIIVDDYLRTSQHHIFACGDVLGTYQFTHTAAHQAWYATVNALFGWAKKFKVDYSVIPWAVFCEPEIARVGLNEQQAKAQNISYEICKYPLSDLDRAIIEDEDYGFIKVLTVPGKDKVLGVSLVGPHAGDLISEYVSAMRHGLGLNKLLGTIHIYPTFSEANKFLAGRWRQSHAPKRLLKWAKWMHRWLRG